MNTFGKLLSGLVGLVLIWILALFFNWRDIEADVTSHVESALQSGGFDRVAVELHDRGRDVLLSGVVRSDSDLQATKTLALDFEGARIVDIDAVEVRPLQPASLSIERRTNRLVVSGLVTDVADGDRIVGSLGNLMQMPVDGVINTSQDVEPASWLEGRDGIAAAMLKVEGAAVRIEKGNLTISGISRSESDYQETLDQLAAVSGVGAVDASGLVVQPWQPSWFSVSGDGESVTLDGQVNSASSANRLRALAAALGGDLSVDNLKIGSEYQKADWLGEAEAAAGYLGGIEQPGIAHRAGTMSLSGTVRTRETYDQVASLSNELPEGFSLGLENLQLRPFEAPRLSFRKTDGVASLQGSVRNSELSGALAAASDSGLTGDASLDNQLKVSGDVMDAEWGDALTGLLSRVSSAEQGELEISEGVLRVAGVVRDEAGYNGLVDQARQVGGINSVDVSDLALRPFKSPRFAISSGNEVVLASGMVGTREAAAKLSEAMSLVFENNDTTQVLVDVDATEATWMNGVIRMMPVMTELEKSSLTANERGIALSGIARSETVFELVSNAASQAVGDGENIDVVNDVALRPWQEPSLEVSATANGLTASGSIAGQERLEQLDRQIADLGTRTGLAPASTMIVGEDIRDREWVSSIGELLPEMASVERLSLRIIDGAAAVSGIVESRNQLDAFSSGLTEALGAAVSLDNQLETRPEPEATPDPEAAEQIVVAAAAEAAEAAAVVYPNVGVDDLRRCETNLDREMLGNTIEFEFASAGLSPDSNRLLNVLANAINGCPEVVIEVGGHTDNVGSADANRQLSEARAQAVVDFFGSVGISADKVTARGYGSERPIADNDSDEGRARNRRIEFNIKTTR